MTPTLSAGTDLWMNDHLTTYANRGTELRYLIPLGKATLRKILGLEDIKDN